MMRRIAVLGAGRVGSAIVRDLAAAGEFDVVAADADAGALRPLEEVPGVRTARIDLVEPGALERVVAEAELVVGAVPGPLGLATARRVVAARRPLVDISFFEEDAFGLDAPARAAGVPVLVDCGLAPGLSNLLAGRAAAEWQRVDRFVCHVGGLPVERLWPFEYRAPFSPIDVIAEYTRPARFRRAGRDVTLPALSEVEAVEFAGVGTLEAFNTDGLRTLLRTLDAPDMVEKTLRYPGHAERMRLLRETGFFRAAPVPLADGTRVAPLAVTAVLLEDAWRMAADDEDVTVFRAVLEGVDRAGQPVRRVAELVDRYDRATGTTSMARTTGYTCTAMVRLVASGRWSAAGVAPPETVAADGGCYEFVLAELDRRGVRLRVRDGVA
jgi:lysine 6-dehydrogenase